MTNQKEDNMGASPVPRKRMRRDGEDVIMTSQPSPDKPEGRNPEHAKLFRSMVQKIASGKLKASEVADLLGRFTANFKMFPRDEKSLEAVFNAPWTSVDPDNFDFTEYEKFLVNLVYCEPNRLEDLLAVWIEALLDDAKSRSHEDIHRRIHGFAKIFTATEEKVVKVLQRFLLLLRNQSAPPLVLLTVHLLRMSAYMPKVSRDLMDVIVRSIAAIDVRVPEEFINDLFDDEDMYEGAEADEFVAAMRAKAHCLDEATEILMKEFLRRLHQGLADKEAHHLQHLLSTSGNVFLTVESTTHLQFVLFFLCSQSESCTQHLLDWLWDLTRNPRSLPCEREAALGYMASFLCRARFVTVKQKQHFVEVMCEWVRAYIQQGPHSTGADFKAHLPFYAACQAIFYVFAFNHRQFMKKKTGLAWAVQLGLDHIVLCSLNPLKHCHPDVVKNFANVGRHYQLVYCMTIIEQNKRSIMPGLEWSSNGELRPVSRVFLNPIFPFDKPLMPRCRKLVEPEYVRYNEADNLPPPLTDPAADSEHYRRVRHDTGGSIGPDAFGYGSSPGFSDWGLQ